MGHYSRLFYTALAVGLFVAFTNHSASAKSSGSCQHAPITIKAGLKYNKARKQLMNNGWQPIIVNPNERANTGQEEDLAQMGFVEVISCGTGLVFCDYAFSDQYSNKLEVRTQGEIWEQNPVPAVSSFTLKCNQ
jgi:hypothetical protein